MNWYSASRGSQSCEEIAQHKHKALLQSDALWPWKSMEELLSHSMPWREESSDAMQSLHIDGTAIYGAET